MLTNIFFPIRIPLCDLFRKRLLSDSQSDDLDNTRDSVLSGQSHSSSDEPELIIIDFEYCAYNYRGFDIANHFIEYTMDYTNKEFPFYYHKKDQYPSKDQQVNRNIPNDQPSEIANRSIFFCRNDSSQLI